MAIAELAPDFKDNSPWRRVGMLPEDLFTKLDKQYNNPAWTTLLGLMLSI